MKDRFWKLRTVIWTSCLVLLTLTGCSISADESKMGTNSVEQTELVPQEQEDDLIRTYQWMELPEGYEQVSWTDFRYGEIKDDERSYDDNVNEAHNNSAGWIRTIPEKLMYNYRVIMKESTEMYGLADYTGHIVIEPKYSKIEYSFMKSGMYYFKAWYEGEEQLIDINGKISDEALPSGEDCLVGENVWSIERDDRGYKIVNEKNEEVGGGYASCTYHDGVVYHEGKKQQNYFIRAVENSKNNRENRKGDEIGIYDCIENTDYMIDDTKISDAYVLEGISREEKTLIYGVYIDLYPDYDYTWGLSAFNYETNEEQRLTDDGRFISVFGNAVIYESNGTYKCVDLQGNNILDDRYFAYAETSAGPLLKRENGEWLCLSEHGEILEASKNFSGTGDAPETYKGHSICTYYEWDGVPCVVVYNDGENQYELYALTK